MSNVQTPVTTEREVTIYATRGGQMKKIMTSANTWGELKPLVRDQGFDLSSLLAAENVNKSDLVNDLAVLPTGPFRLFLRPAQTKSGANPDRKECFSIIKAHITANPGDKAKFTIDGKNMTQLSTLVLQDLVAKYCSGKSKAKAVVAEAPVKEKVKAKVSEKAEDCNQGAQESSAGIVSRVISLISQFSNLPSFEKANKHLNRLLAETDTMNWDDVETEEEALRREARELGY